MAAKALMFQGTGSSVGKSLLVAGFARALLRRGHSVRPFKPQNMSNNAAVTQGGGEIGRAQALQARAAGVAPTVDMNPVLLKPQSEHGSQIILHGKIWCTARAREYQALKAKLLPEILASFARLKDEADFVLVEGAGSAAEINLRENDIANMGFARAAEVPVVIVGDIDRGGVIASLVGIKSVISPADAELIHGFLVNKMRGDASLFDDGMAFIARRTGWLPLGLIPFFERASALPDEDGLDLAARIKDRGGGGRVRVAVPMLPGIANFDDFDPLRAEPDVDLVMVPRGEPLPAPCDLVILAGSKTTIADLEEFRVQGWDIDLAAHRRRGGAVLGICGGYQMLGRSISDPGGIEGEPRSIAGLDLLQVETVLGAAKQLVEVEGEDEAGVPMRGYEMHIGTTKGEDTERPAFTLADGRADGAVSKDGGVVGTYVHGLFAGNRQRAAWLERLGGRGAGADYEGGIEETLDALAAHLEAHTDIDALIAIAR
jgi:adenosylcobyric acid synthase